MKTKTLKKWFFEIFVLLNATALIFFTQSSFTQSLSPGDDVSPVEEADGHVLARPWITFHHLVSGLETGSRDLVHSGGLVVGLPVFVNV